MLTSMKLKLTFYSDIIFFVVLKFQKDSSWRQPPASIVDFVGEVNKYFKCTSNNGRCRGEINI